MTPELLGFIELRIFLHSVFWSVSVTWLAVKTAPKRHKLFIGQR